NPSNAPINAPTAGVLLGNGDGTFQAALGVSTGGGSPFAVADVNGDGRPDLVTDRSVLRGNGDGSFQAPLSFGLAGGAYQADAVTVADVNGDGRPDLIAVAAIMD